TNYPGVLGFTAYFKNTEFNIVTAGSGTVPLITNPRLPGRQVNLPYSAQLTATAGSVGGYTFSIVSGSLPAGLSLSAGGAITGSRPSVAFGTTNYLLVWQDDAASPSDDIYGQLISRSGQLVGAPFPISAAAGEQELDSFQHVIFTGENFFVAWRDGRTASVPG